jgi:hypothetical protein
VLILDVDDRLAVHLVEAILADGPTGLSGTFTLKLNCSVSVTVPSFSCYASLTGLVVFLR